MSELRKGTAVNVIVGTLLEDDGTTAMTTVADTETLLHKHDGTSIAAKNDTTDPTHLSSSPGSFIVDLDTTDTGTLGPLRVAFVKTGCLPCWRDFDVIAEDIWDAKYGTALYPVNVEEVGGSTQDVASQTSLDLYYKRLRSEHFLQIGYDSFHDIEIIHGLDTATGRVDFYAWDPSTRLRMQYSEADLHLGYIDFDAETPAFVADANIAQANGPTDATLGTLLEMGVADGETAMTTGADPLLLRIAMGSSGSPSGYAYIYFPANSVHPYGLVREDGDLSKGNAQNADGFFPGASYVSNVPGQVQEVNEVVDGLASSLAAAKGATFDTATDSLEAIRNRGDVAWVTGAAAGSGSWPVTKDAAGVDALSAKYGSGYPGGWGDVYADTDTSRSVKLASVNQDNNGAWSPATLMLDAGNYDIVWDCPGYADLEIQFTVADGGTVTLR